MRLPCKCPDCGKGMARLGEDVTEVLDYVPGHFQVIRHDACDAVTQAPAPVRNIRASSR